MRTYYGLFHPIEEENWKGYGVTFPDVPGSITEGYSLDEAKEMAVEALSIILGCGCKGRDYTEPSTYEGILTKAEPGDLVFPVTADERIVAENRPKKRVNLHLPDSQLAAIAGLIEGVEGMNRSKFVTDVIDYYLAAKSPNSP